MTIFKYVEQVGLNLFDMDVRSLVSGLKFSGKPDDWILAITMASADIGRAILFCLEIWVDSFTVLTLSCLHDMDSLSN